MDAVDVIVDSFVADEWKELVEHPSEKRSNNRTMEHFSSEIDWSDSFVAQRFIRIQNYDRWK